MPNDQITERELSPLITNKDWESIVKLVEINKIDPKRRVQIPGLDKMAGYYILPAMVSLGANVVVRKLLDMGANPNQRDEGETPLHIACEKQNHEAIEMLLNAGADLEQTRSYVEGEGGETALMLASENYDVWAVKALLKSGANPSALTKRKSQNAVWFATSTDHRKRAAERVAVIHALAEAGCKMVGNELHWPIYRRDVGLVKLLVELGCPVNELISFSEPHGPRKGETPLTLAVETSTLDTVSRRRPEVSKAKAEIVEKLLSAQANPNTPNAKGQTPLLFTVIGHQWDVAMQLGGPGTALNLAKLLLAAGADPMLCPANSKHGSALDFAKKINAQPFIELFTAA